MTNKKERMSRIGVLAGLFLALTSLGIAVHQTRIITHLLREGKRADAVVVDIDYGYRRGKKAILRFTTETGETVTARSLFQMHLIRNHRSDEVTVLYDPSEPKIATIDLGIWTWQEPAFLYFGFVFLTVLSFVMLNLKSKRFTKLKEQAEKCGEGPASDSINPNLQA